MIFGVPVGEILINYWFASALVLAWAGGFSNYLMFARSVNFETPSLVKRSISFALTWFYPFAVCGLLKRFGVLGLDPTTATYFKILPFVALAIALVSFFLNPLIVLAFKKIKMPFIGSSLVLILVMYSATLVGSYHLKKLKNIQNVVATQARMCEQNPTVNVKECEARDRSIASELSSDAVCMKSLFRKDQVLCLEKRARVHKSIASCKRVEAIGQDPKTHYIEDKAPTVLTALSSVSRTQLELVLGSCYFHVGDRLELQEFCAASFKEQNLSKLLSARCFQAEYFKANLGKERLTQAMFFLNISSAGAGAYGRYLPSWKEIIKAKPDPLVLDSMGNKLIDYVSNSDSCDEECRTAFSQYVGTYDSVPAN